MGCWRCFMIVFPRSGRLRNAGRAARCASGKRRSVFCEGQYLRPAGLSQISVLAA
ncbi:hypothetical protein CBM2597_A150123 [Cupriavidus taiwanensis]|nr:hypothetical protein CBM2597_A150123 [Cupriavidus taiwanensis]